MTRNSFAGIALSALATIGLIATNAHAQTTFTAWDFDNVNTAATTGNTVPTTAPLTTVGNGAASTLGMINSYTVGGATPNTSDASDVFETTATADQGSSDPTTQASNNIWRVRGTNGWNSTAPQYTQGAQFTTSTVGFTNVSLSFDWFATKQGVDNLQVQYTTDGTTYQNIGSVFSFPTSTAGNLAWMNQNTVSFSGITAANNDPNFGIRLVSAYAPGTSTYQNTTGTALNNTSGNWRFDEVKFTGAAVTATPESNSIAGMVIGAGALALLVARRRKVTNF